MAKRAHRNLYDVKVETYGVRKTGRPSRRLVSRRRATDPINAVRRVAKKKQVEMSDIKHAWVDGEKVGLL